MSRIVTIDIRVRAELSDRLPLALLSVDTNIEVPLKMVEITGPTSVCVTRVLPKVLTVQHGMHEDEAVRTSWDYHSRRALEATTKRRRRHLGDCQRNRAEGA
jgi:hypothetical protein